MKKVSIVDYGTCNLDSIRRAVEECGADAVVTDQPRDLAVTSAIILPGVGAFAVAMQNLNARGLSDALAEQVLNKRVPFLGICLGMQLLATRGTEGGEMSGLGWIQGEVRRLQPVGPDERVPHVGWNDILVSRPSTLFDGIPDGSNFYFVHSYHLHCYHEDTVLARTPYCGGFVSAVWKDNIFGVQFHPEKSQRLGFQALKNFLAL